VQTPLDFSNELLRSSTQHERAGLRCGALGKDVETFTTNLALFERATCTKMTLLDIAACRLRRRTGRLAHPVHIVRSNTTRTEDVAISKVPVESVDIN
jgi:hypothetical protein